MSFNKFDTSKTKTAIATDIMWMYCDSDAKDEDLEYIVTDFLQGASADPEQRIIPGDPQSDAFLQAAKMLCAMIELDEIMTTIEEACEIEGYDCKDCPFDDDLFDIPQCLQGYCAA